LEDLRQLVIGPQLFVFFFQLQEAESATKWARALKKKIEYLTEDRGKVI
jgi:hypothetical protein